MIIAEPFQYSNKHVFMYMYQIYQQHELLRGLHSCQICF